MGIEIGATAVRVVGVSTGRKPVFVGCKEIVMSKHDLPSMAAAIKEALKTAAPHRLHPSGAAILIPEKDVFRKTIELPVMTQDSELREALRLELAGFLPENGEETEFDYQYLGDLAKEQAKQFMVVAASRSLIQGYLDALKLAGIPVTAVDTVPAALGRATMPISEKRAAAVVYLEAASATVSLYRQGNVWVSSTINQGTGSDEQLSSERMKRLSGALADEVDHVIKFYANRTAGERNEVDDIRIVGAGPDAEALKASLEKDLGLKAMVAKPSIAVPAFCGTAFLPALGASLYGHFEKL